MKKAYEIKPSEYKTQKSIVTTKCIWVKNKQIGSAYNIFFPKKPEVLFDFIDKNIQ